MKKTFEMPEIEIIKFETENVMTASAPVDDDNSLGWEPIN